MSKLSELEGNTMWSRQTAKDRGSMSEPLYKEMHKKQGVYNYDNQKAPTYQPEHNQYRWSDTGKLASHPNLDDLGFYGHALVGKKFDGFYSKVQNVTGKRVHSGKR